MGGAELLGHGGGKSQDLNIAADIDNACQMWSSAEQRHRLREGFCVAVADGDQGALLRCIEGKCTANTGPCACDGDHFVFERLHVELRCWRGPRAERGRSVPLAAATWRELRPGLRQAHRAGRATS